MFSQSFKTILLPVFLVEVMAWVMPVARSCCHEYTRWVYSYSGPEIVSKKYLINMFLCTLMMLLLLLLELH